MIWAVPGVTPPGSICDKGVDMMSLYPTICELAGVPIPKHVEGISIKPLLKNPNEKWTTPGLSTMGKGNHTLVNEDWRYIRYADGTEELYDERNDPNEWVNVAARPEHAGVIKKLAAFLPKINADPVESDPEPERKKRGNAQPEPEGEEE